MKRMNLIAAWALALTLLFTSFALGEATPDDLPAGDPAEATSLPAETELPEVTPEPTATALPEVAEPVPAWDEALCDHANLNCEQAPACEVDGCTHIAEDVHGLPYPLCEKGRWALDRQDELLRAAETQGEAAKSVRSDVIDLDEADASIWRSGVYTVTGGSKRKAELTIAENRLVILRLNSIDLSSLQIGGHADVTVTLSGQNHVSTLALGQDAKLCFQRGGVIVLDTVEQGNASITVSGGNVSGSFEEADGKACHVFNAAGMTSVTIAGKAWPANLANEDGRCSLWLPEAAAGAHWQGQLEGTELVVTEVTDTPGKEKVIVSGAANDITESGDWLAAGTLDDGTSIHIAASGVTLDFREVIASGSPLITADRPLTIRLSDGSQVTGTLVTGHAVTFEGTGSLRLSAVPEGYAAYDLDYELNHQKVTLNGRTIPLVICDSKLLLPALSDGSSYDITPGADTIAVKTISEQQSIFHLDQTRLINTAVTSFTVYGAGQAVEGAITSTAPKASATLRRVHLTGSQPVLTVEGHADIHTVGDCLLSSTGEVIALGSGASLTLTTDSGRLDLVGALPASLTLTGNIRTTSSDDTCQVQIRSQSGKAVANKALTIQIGERSWRFMTFDDGCLYLRGLNIPSGEAIAASDGETVYTAVLLDDQGTAIETLKIGRVSFEDLPDGTLKVNCKADGAGTAGIMFISADDVSDLPDTFVSDASYMPLENGSIFIKGLEAGTVVTARGYGTLAENAELNDASADGFMFGKTSSHVHRAPLTAESLDAAYTGKPYHNPLKLPEGATVTYKGKNLDGKGRPILVGRYSMTVTIPEGDSLYLPGDYTFDFEITKIELIIVPSSNLQKYQYEEDPPFTYTVRGLLEGDEVTGELLREEGEAIGNYAFIISQLKAPKWYTLRLSRQAAVFTILPNPDDYDDPGGFVEFFEVLHPVHQEIVRKDGRKVAVVLNGQDSLTITYSRIGSVVFATEDDRSRTFSPLLVYNEDADEVMLRLRAEPEQNKDHGYKLDQNGKVVYGGRYFKLGWYGLRGIHNLGIDAVCLLVDGAAVSMRLDDLISSEAQAWIKSSGFALDDAQFRLVIEPESEAEPFNAMLPVTKAWHVSVQLYTRDRSRHIDITERVPSLDVRVDMESTARLMTSLDRYEEADFAGMFSIYGGTVEADRLPTAFVEPWMPDELEKSDFPGVLSTHRYLSARPGSAMWITVAQ